MFGVLFFKVTVFADGWAVVASGGRAVNLHCSAVSVEVRLLLKRMENEIMKRRRMEGRKNIWKGT
jgi:hypothetical protein